MSTESYEIMVVDDHPIVRQGLAALLAQQPDMRVTLEAGGAEEALLILHERHPDMVLVDLTLNGMSGLELVRRLSLSDRKLPVLVISMHDERVYAERALQAGASGYIMKQEASDALVLAIRHILGGGTYLSANMAASLQDDANNTGNKGSSLLSTLTSVEFEVFQQIASGQNITEIAEGMGRSVKTVESHRTNIRRKLGFRSSHELGHYAARWQVENDS